jgi:copper oxidase (laccase) domain-containing protein
VREAFVKADAGTARYFSANSRGRWQADLAALARRRLDALGVADVHGGTWCTFTDRERFFSHRRDGRAGRMAALIWKQQC